MTDLNLLPWRDTRRAARRLRFFRALAVAAGLAMTLLGLSQWQMRTAVAAEAEAIAVLRQQLVAVDRQLGDLQRRQAEAGAERQRQRSLQARLAQREQVVHLLDELAATAAVGVHYTAVVRSGDALTVEGRTRSNAALAGLLRRLQDSAWFADPEIGALSALGAAAEAPAAGESSRFTLRVALTTPAPGQ